MIYTEYFLYILYIYIYIYIYNIYICIRIIFVSQLNCLKNILKIKYN